MTMDVSEIPDKISFFKSYYLAGKEVKDPAAFYKMILDYMFARVKPKEDDRYYGSFLLVQKVVDKSVTNAINAAKKKAEEEANTEANTEANGNRIRKRNKNKGFGMRGARAVDFDTVKSWADTHFCPPPDGDFLRMWHSRMEESGWVDGRGHDLIARGTWQRELSVWWAREKEKKSSARAASPSGGDVVTGADGMPLRCGAEPDMV